MTFRSANLGVLCISMVAFAAPTLLAGCQKKFDPNSFDAGAPAASASATVAAVDSSAVTDDAAAASAEPLAPLQEGKPHAPAGGAVAGGSNAVTKPKTDPQECIDGRKVCGARIITAASKKECDSLRFACFNKGGHL